MRFGRRKPIEHRSWSSRATHLLRNFLAGLAALFLVITFTPVVTWWTALLQGPADDATGEVMVVLAGSTMDGGLLGQGSYWRSAFAVREYQHGGYKRIIVTGGGGVPPVAPSMKHYLVAAGIDEKLIETEVKSGSTLENAQFTAHMLLGERRRVALVTSDYHMRRAARMFEKQGIQVIRRPYPDAAARAQLWSRRWEIAYELAVETGKIIYHKTRGEL